MGVSDKSNTLIINCLNSLYPEHSLPFDIQNQESFKQLCVFFEKNSELPIRYVSISFFVFENKESSEFITALEDAITKRYHSVEIPVGLTKLINHMDLAILQTKQFGSKKELEEEIEKSQKLKNELHETKNSLEKLNNSQATIYTSFITVLGLFSSLIFALFGGFKATTDIANAQHKLSDLLVIFGSIGLIMVCVIFLFFNYLQVFSKKIEPIQLERPASLKYPIFFWSLTPLMILIVLGISLKIFSAL